MDDDEFGTPPQKEVPHTQPKRHTAESMAASAIANRELYNRLGLMFRGIQQEAHASYSALDRQFAEGAAPDPTEDNTPPHGT